MRSSLVRVGAASAALAAGTALAATAHAPALGHDGALARAPLSTRAASTDVVGGYSPQQMRTAYDLNSLIAAGNDGHGTTIAIVDSYGSPTIANDLAQFDAQFSLPPPPSLTVVAPAGTIPAFDPSNSDMAGWADETSLDVEWAHALAPGASIELVETPVSETEGVHGFPQIVAAENAVINNGSADVISQSFGATEATFPSRKAVLKLRSAFIDAKKHGVTVLAASGDAGATDLRKSGQCCFTRRANSWPSSDPLVTSVGGTDIRLDANGNRLARDSVWHDYAGASGGGLSQFFKRPAYQKRVNATTMRATPDVSLNASVVDSVPVYVSYSGVGLWQQIGGTSAATPMFAAITAIADQVAGHRLGLLNPALYSIATHANAGIVDVTHGNNSFAGVTGYKARRGYDRASGLGTVDAAALVPSLLAHSPSGPPLSGGLQH